MEVGNTRIEFRIYYTDYGKGRGKAKSQHVFFPNCTSSSCTNGEALEIIRDYPEQDFIFLDYNNDKKDITCERLLASLKTIELNKKSNDIDLLNRIIRQGGFTQYIARMENAKKKNQNKILPQ